ncbi:MAG: alpha-2,3-sialyltransferase [Alysiella sp.]|uniref:alpha-2,3-sialyltransferase n=1 Tax=Alysiella sp. TaxID=1872483 RepID=UPI0026DCCAD1|nr:alpha-2,3-sialyltransferase [Alysiella sp.]MDO4433335.1 alpha-2,3-sialyltransferase [Alysiella sp.]
MQINESKAVLVAGNGPSLTQIDYNLLPQDIDVFRCNQFYLEEQYYVGKKIKAAFFHHGLFMEQQATMSILLRNQEYECEHIVYSDLESQLSQPELTQDLLYWFPDTLNAFTLYREKLPELAKYTQQLALFENKILTSGAIMAVIAAAMGYQNIYIAGIDFYTGNQMYAFDNKKNNLLKLVPEFKQDTITPNWHDAETDLSVLKMLQTLYGIQIYTISPSSPLSTHFPLAPQTQYGKENRTKLAFAKAENALKDIAIPNSYLYRYLRNKYFPATDKPALKNNLFYRFFHDLFHLPSDIRKYIRHKRKGKQS